MHLNLYISSDIDGHITMCFNNINEIHYYRLLYYGFTMTFEIFE